MFGPLPGDESLAFCMLCLCESLRCFSNGFDGGGFFNFAFGDFGLLNSLRQLTLLRNILHLLLHNPRLTKRLQREILRPNLRFLQLSRRLYRLSLRVHLRLLFHVLLLLGAGHCLGFCFGLGAFFGFFLGQFSFLCTFLPRQLIFLYPLHNSLKLICDFGLMFRLPLQLLFLLHALFFLRLQSFL